MDELLPYTMDELNARIDCAEADIAAGRVLSSEQLFKEMDEYMECLLQP